VGWDPEFEWPGHVHMLYKITNASMSIFVRIVIRYSSLPSRELGRPFAVSGQVKVRGCGRERGSIAVCCFAAFMINLWLH